MADRTQPKKETESEQIVAALGTVFRTRRPLLLACALGVLIPVLAFNELAPPVYEASTSLVFEELASPGEDLTAQAAREFQMFNRIEEMNSLAFSEDLARSLPDSLFARIRLPRRKPEGVDRMELAGTVLHEGVRAFPLRNTNIIRVRARTTDPELSVAVANLAPTVLQARSQRIRTEGATGIRSLEFEIVDVVSSGNLAAETGIATMHIQPAGQAASTAKVKYVVVYRKVGDAWLLYRDIWNSMPAAAAAPAPTATPEMHHH